MISLSVEVKNIDVGTLLAFIFFQMTSFVFVIIFVWFFWSVYGRIGFFIILPDAAISIV